MASQLAEKLSCYEGPHQGVAKAAVPGAPGVGATEWQSGATEWESGTTEWESGTTVWESGTMEWESGTMEWESGTMEWESGTTEWEICATVKAPAFRPVKRTHCKGL
jgi:hypothetical protein